MYSAAVTPSFFAVASIQRGVAFDLAEISDRASRPRPLGLFHPSIRRETSRSEMTANIPARARSHPSSCRRSRQSPTQSRELCRPIFPLDLCASVHSEPYFRMRNSSLRPRKTSPGRSYSVFISCVRGVTMRNPPLRSLRVSARNVGDAKLDFDFSVGSHLQGPPI